METRIQKTTGALMLLALLLLNSPFSTALAQRIQPIYIFNNDVGTGTLPAALTLGPDGNFYGTTYKGGSHAMGTVFKVTTNGTLRSLYSFSETVPNTNTDGANPTQVPLTLGPDGNFYGTTLHGGSSGVGTVFQITTNGALTPLHSFSAPSWNGTAYVNYDGYTPNASLTMGSDGNLYGMNSLGGTAGNGTIFLVTANGSFATVHSFTALDLAGHNIDGAQPGAGLTVGPDGNFYGTTDTGGSSGAGTVFRFNGSTISLTTLHSFSLGHVNNSGIYTNSDGAIPTGPLTLGPDGDLYGTTQSGGSDGVGTIFRITTTGTFTTLVNFDNTNGASSHAGMILGPDGNFYGTTYGGGSSNVGTLFQLTTNGTLTSVADFNNANGANPGVSIALGPDGKFYGAAYHDGTGAGGEIYRLDLLPVIITTKSSFGFSNGLFGFDVSGVPGQTQVVFGSTNLTIWVPLQTNVLSNSLWYFSDPSTSNSSQRFYNVLSP